MWEWHWDLPGVFWPFFGVFAVVAFAVLAFDIWMLVDAIQRPPHHFSSPEAKTMWIVGLVVGLITWLPATVIAIAYYFAVRKPATAGRSSRAEPAQSYPPSPPPGGPAPAAPPPAATTSAYCSSCGAKLVAGARFCHSCGAPTTA